MDNTDRVLDFVQGLRIDDIPDHVLHHGKRCFLDALGALLAGTATPVARIMTDFALNYFPGNQATILVNGGQASPVGASLANGYAANALDMDDGYRLVKGHPGSCLLPVLFAAAETADPAPDGPELLTAFIIGYEVSIRAGLIRTTTASVYHTSGSWGAVGGAALAGRLLNLDRTALREALGTAEYHGPIASMMRGISKPCMAKDTIGWGAMVAVSSALMAKSGFTGAHPFFDEVTESAWIDELGRDYKFLNLYFKPYCACRWAQPAITGALKVLRENSLSAQSISAIRVRTFVNAAALSQAHPQDTENAQYNFTYPIAAALMDGEVGPRQVLPPRIFDRDLLRLADRIQVEVDPKFEAAFPRKTFAEVFIRTTDGRELTSGPVEPKWEPPGLPSDKELEEKFHSIVIPVLGAGRSPDLVSLIWNFEKIQSIRELVALCLPKMNMSGNKP
jgi:2-methylcitrate dehydratase PrpD